ncbi:MAG: type II toxin-antitoxin system RelE/ParE family toxin [Rubrivivax sp.]
MTTQVEFAPRVSEDFERIHEHLLRTGAADIEGRFESILEACAVLEQHPLIGRRVGGELRELVIGKGSRGYLALYRYAPEVELVMVVAVRAQSEEGYRGGG